MDHKINALGQWSSQWAFILAATGSAVGLGNIWKFPYIAGDNGGGAFVLVYLLCITFIGLPLLIAEIAIGRRGKQNPQAAFHNLARSANRHPGWRFVGSLAILASFLILSYYSVIAGWALDYVVKTAMGTFNHQAPQAIEQIFNHFTASPFALLFWHTFNIAMTTFVVCLGIEKGLESSVKFLFPAMLALIIIIAIYSFKTGYFAHGVSFLFHPNFHELTGKSILIALGHAFFTLGLATSCIMMYGAYLPSHAKIIRAGFFIALADTFIALIAGLAIFPIVFANDLSPGSGPGLIFVTLPIAFGHMPYGQLIGTLFFIMLVFAAFTSCISLLEPSVAWLIEGYQYTRKKAVLMSGFAIWFLGLGTVGSFNVTKSFKIMGLNFFDAMDHLTANIMLPVGGLATAIFIAWIYPNKMTAEELEINEKSKLFLWLKISLGYLTPIAIVAVFLHAVKII